MTIKSLQLFQFMSEVQKSHQWLSNEKSITSQNLSFNFYTIKYYTLINDFLRSIKKNAFYRQQSLVVLMCFLLILVIVFDHRKTHAADAFGKEELDTLESRQSQSTESRLLWIILLLILSIISISDLLRFL